MVRGPVTHPTTTTTEQVAAPSPGVFARAEAGSRQIVLQVGIGVISFIVGSIFAAGAGTRVLERLGPIENELIDTAARVVFERLWIFLMLPLFGFAVGRFTQIPALRFTLLAGLSGELFSVLLVAGINGFDYLVDDPQRVLTRLVTLFIGLAITMRALIQGRTAGYEAQLAAQAQAEARKKEYAEYLAAAEAKSTPPPPADAP